jgi:hypothetical protein
MSSNTKLYWLHDVSKATLIGMGVRSSSICENITVDSMTQCEMTEDQAKSLIPTDTPYCYKTIGSGEGKPKFVYCPYWDKIQQFPHQGNGYCHFMMKGDDSMGGLLWDQIKECGVSDDSDREPPDELFDLLS